MRLKNSNHANHNHKDKSKKCKHDSLRSRLQRKCKNIYDTFMIKMGWKQVTL